MKRFFLLSVLAFVVIVAYATEGDSLKSITTATDFRMTSSQTSLDQLKKMPTEELLHSCMEYPGLYDFVLCGRGLQGFDNIAKEYDGFAELFNRNDFANVLLREYQDLPNQISKILEANDTIKGALSFKYLIYEYMMSKDEFIEKIKKSEDSMNSEAIIVNTFEIITKYPELFSGIHAKPMVKLLNSGIQGRNNKEKMSRMLAEYGYYISASVSTPNGTPIESAIQWVGTDYTSSEQANIISRVVSHYVIDSIVAPPSVRYNQHAYAWHMPYGGDTVCIIGCDPLDHPTNGYYLAPYWEDGSFYECTQNDDYEIVLYAGDLSARNLGNGLYESKWDDWPVVRHLPNNVPSFYLPNQPKRYFKKVNLSLSGPTIPGSPSIYSVQGLPPNWYVVWSMVGKTTLPSYCTANYPAAHQLQINNSSKKHIKETLVAKVYMANGTLVKTFTKFINTADGFSGTYTQTIPIPYEVISGDLYDGSNILVNQGINVYLTSSDFNGATVTSYGFDTPTISTSGNTITFRFHSSTSLSSCTLHCVNGDKVIEFSLRAFPILIEDPILHIMAGGGDGNSGVTITLGGNEESGDRGQYDVEQWSLAIYNYETGELVYKQQVSGSSVSIDTSRWAPGIYVAYAKIGDKEISQKFVVK